MLSPSTRLIDLNLKLARYQAAGCPSYWVIDPDPAGGPVLRTWELQDTAYEPGIGAGGSKAFRTERPFPVTIDLAALVV